MEINKMIKSNEFDNNNMFYQFMNVIHKTKSTHTTINKCLNIIGIKHLIIEFCIGSPIFNLHKEFNYNINNCILKSNRFGYVYDDENICLLCYVRACSKDTCGNHTQDQLTNMYKVLITWDIFLKNAKIDNQIDSSEYFKYIKKNCWIE
jgi:hypothetical protein